MYTRHTHCLCTNDTLCNIRNLSNTAINATLAKFQLLQQHAPHPTISIVEAIGDALTTADAPSGGTYILTSADNLRTEINRLHRLNKYYPPPQHPYQYALRHLPLLIRAGLLPVSPHDTNGTTDPITSHLHLGLLPASLNARLTNARKTFVQKARNRNPTAWLDTHYHELCPQESSLAALFPESEIKDDDGNKILVRRTTQSTLLYLQRELYFVLQQRAIRLYQITTALVKHRQHQICQPPLDTPDEPLLTPTRQPMPTPKADTATSTNNTNKGRQKKGKNRQRAPKTPNPNRQFPCPNYLCVIRRHTNPEGGGRTTKDNGEVCEQCKQHQKSLKLCTALEAIVQGSPTIQTILTSSATWKRETITTTLLEDQDVLNEVQALNTARKIKSSNQLTKCPITSSAFQLLANTILRRPDTESRYYDKPPNEADLDSLYQLIHLDTCACEHDSPPPKRPTLCLECNLSRRHEVPPTHCTLCTTLLPTDRQQEPDTLRNSPHNTACATCSITLLCRFNSAAGRSQRTQHSTSSIPNPYATPTSRAIAAPPIPANPNGPQQRAPPPPAPPPPPQLHLSPGETTRLPTAAELFPLDSSLEAAIRLDVMQSTANPDTFLTALNPRGSTKHRYKPIKGLRLRDIVRLRPATSTDQWLNDDLINSALALFWSKSHNTHDPARIGFISSNKLEVMERRPNSTTAKRAIYRKPKQRSPWLAHANTDIILYPYRPIGSAHWSLGIHDTRKKTAQYYEGFNVGTNRKKFLAMIRKTAYRHAPSMTFIAKTGPKQPNDYDCGVTLLLTAYVWYFHPDPHNFNWDDIMKLRNLIPHFRRVLIIALCTGEIPNIFASSGPSGLPFTSTVAIQSQLPFQPIARPLAAPTDKTPTSPSRGPPQTAMSIDSSNEEDGSDDDDISIQSGPTDSKADHNSSTTTTHEQPTLQRHRDLPLTRKKYILQAHHARRHPLNAATASGTSTRILTLISAHATDITRKAMHSTANKKKRTKRRNRNRDHKRTKLST